MVCVEHFLASVCNLILFNLFDVKGAGLFRAPARIPYGGSQQIASTVSGHVQRKLHLIFDKNISQKTGTIFILTTHNSIKI